MKFDKYINFIAILFAPLMSVAQVNITGSILDKDNSEPLAGASVMVKDTNGKIKKFTSTNTNGAFAMQMTSIGGCRLEVTMMGFAKQSIPLDSVVLPVTVYMETGTIQLKEVAIKADRIREQGDTVTYNVGSFAQTQDRTIGDVLKRMPGIDVADDGKIQYQGEDINKFYIEGSDLLGGRYGIATNGISHDDVGSVEVMENHQPLQVLSGISFSDKAAINLKLKNKAKATWSFHGDAGGGYSWQTNEAIWDGELFAMAVMPNFQNITTLKTNNVGEDLSAQATDFFASRRGTSLRRYVDVSLPGVPSLSRKRTLFNRSALVSSNSLWKMGRGEVKAQIAYSFNRVTADAANITTYFLDGGDRIVTEDRSGVDRSHSLSGKFIYEMNQKTAFINNTIKTNLDWDDIRLNVTGSLPNYQSASLPDYHIGNDFKLIKRFNGKHLVTFQSTIEWESLPQTLYVGKEQNAENDVMLRQIVKDHAFYTNESAAYAFSVNGVTISLEGGVKGYVRTLNTDMSDISRVLDEDFLHYVGTANVLNTNYFTVYVTPKFEYWVKRVSITLNAPVSFAHYEFDKALANRSETYFSPSLSMNWKPNNRFSMGLRGGLGRYPMNLNMIQPGFVMTDYRSFRSGVDDFYNTTSQNVSANFSYKHTRKGLFANAFVMQSWSHNPYTMAQQLYGDYVVYSYTPAKSDGKVLMASGNIGKTLDFMRGSMNLNGTFSRNEANLISENSTVKSVGTSWSTGIKINGSLLRWLSLDYRFDFSSSRLAMNKAEAAWLSGMENELQLDIMPHRKWVWQIIGEYYHNELTENQFKDVFLLDTKAIFKLNKRIELSASLSNILNHRTYSYKSYNQLSSYESLRWLRGRELLISISLKK